jgi:hypothetical protein
VTPGTVSVGFLDNGTWSACFGLSYRDLLLHDISHHQRIIRKGGRELRAVTSTGQVAVNRNKVAAGFLGGTDSEWLLMVDTDMGFGPDTADRLVSAADPDDRPVVGALCFAASRDETTTAPLHGDRFSVHPTLYQWVDLPGESGFQADLDYPRDSLMRVDGTGAACLLVHRSVLEEMRAGIGEAWFDCLRHETAGRNWTPRWFSEDLSFCLRLRDAGVPVHVHTGVKTVHDKGVLFLDEEIFDRQQALGVSTGGDA